MPDPHSGAQPTRALALSTIAFTVCFAVWTIFSIIGIQIKEELGLSETQFGLLIGMPILTGSLVRLLLGIWTDRFGGRIVYTATMVLAVIATALLSLAETYPQFLVAALGVGLAGGLLRGRRGLRLALLPPRPARAPRSASSAWATSARR